VEDGDQNGLAIHGMDGIDDPVREWHPGSQKACIGHLVPQPEDREIEPVSSPRLGKR